jgi:hypothetical protein
MLSWWIFLLRRIMPKPLRWMLMKFQDTLLGLLPLLPSPMEPLRLRLLAAFLLLVFLYVTMATLTIPLQLGHRLTLRI